MTGFLYDGNQVIAEFNEDGKVISQHIHGSGLGGDVGSLVYKEELNSANEVDTSYYFYNYRGDVIDVESDTGTVSYRYDAFGNIIGASYPELGFSSKRFDAGTGLSYFGARYYDSLLGRFISRDPMGYIDGLNQYIYVANNPLYWVDPYGCNARMLNKIYNFAASSLLIANVAIGYDTSSIFLPKWDQGGIIDPNPDLQAPDDNITYITPRDPNEGLITTPIGKPDPNSGILKDPPAPDIMGTKFTTPIFQYDEDMLISKAKKSGKNNNGGVAPVNKGKQGVKKSETQARKRGEKIQGKEVTFELPSGKRTRIDIITIFKGILKIIESKNGPTAKLTKNQKELQKTIQEGKSVIPRGKRAKQADLEVGVPVKIKEFQVDRH